MKKLSIFILSLILAIFMFQAAHATEYYAPVQGSTGYQEITATTGTAVSLTIPTSLTIQGAMARVYVSAYPAAFKSNGVAPTSATVQQLAVGSFYYINTLAEMQSFQAIGIGGSSVLAVQYYILQRAD